MGVRRAAQATLVVATGMLEAVLHAGDRLPAPLKRAMGFAGPEARAHCMAWNEFSGAKTEW